MFVLFSSFLFAQNTIKNKEKSSVFSDFEQIGIKKALFLEQFGHPTSKDMAYDQEKNKVETLYYREDLKKEKIIILSAFTFKNDELIEQKSRIETCSINGKMIEKIADDLTFIKQKVRFD